MVLEQRNKRDNGAGIALGCGVGGVVAAFALYWLVVPGIVLGIAAVVLGRRAHRRGCRELGSMAMTLGLVAVLAVPAVITTANSAEEWGRDCALNPESDPNC